MHYDLDDPEAPSAERIRDNLRRYAALGVKVRISEMDLSTGQPNPDALGRQARRFADVLGACLAEKSCKGFSTWGFTDRYAMLPDTRTGALGHGTIFDESVGPKPAYAALAAALTR
jgi:endo-1,4-beta-xylanase